MPESGESWLCEGDDCDETFDTWAEAARHERDEHGIYTNSR